MVRWALIRFNMATHGTHDVNVSSEVFEEHGNKLDDVTLARQHTVQRYVRRLGQHVLQITTELQKNTQTSQQRHKNVLHLNIP